MKFILFFVLFFPFLFFSQTKKHDHKHVKTYGFVENKGQWDKNVLFQNKFEGGNLWLMQHKFLYHFQDFSDIHAAHFTKDNKPKIATDYKQDVLHVNFPNSNEVVEIEKSDKSEYYYNYFIGKEKDKWASQVFSYEKLTFKNFYDGIDMNLTNSNANLKYEFIVKSKVSPKIIELNYVGQQSIKITKSGNLEITSKLGKIVEEKPFAYQIVEGKQLQIPCEFVLKNNNLTFKIGKYDDNLPLIIDPELIFATYNGAFGDNFGFTATYGYDGTAYSGGIIFGNQMPIPDSNTYDILSNFTVPNAGFGRTDVFINKYSQDGSQMLWSTFLGGGNDFSGTEAPNSLICDNENNVYIFGVTSSIDFPTTVNAFSSIFQGGSPFNISGNGVNLDIGSDIFVSKISANGQNLLASSYFGGNQNDGINTSSLAFNYGDQFRGEIMIDSLNQVYVASCTYSQNFPTQNAVQSTHAGNLDGIVFKVTDDLSTMLFSTFIGGSADDALYSVKIDSAYNVVFGGGTNSMDINPSFFVNSYKSTNQGGTDGILGKLNENGQNLKLSYLGHQFYDQVFFVETNPENEIFVLGQTVGAQFPVVNANYSNPNSSQFVAKFDPDLSSMLQATLIGDGNSGFPNFSPCAFLVDLCGNIYVSGWGAAGANLPTTPDAPQLTSSGSNDFYLLVLRGDFNNLLYATFLGGPFTNDHVDGGTSRYDRNGVVYQSVCAGCGASSDFPVTSNAWSSVNNSPNCNNLVYKFDFKLIGNSNFSVTDTVGCSPFTVNFENSSSNAHLFEWNFGNGSTSTSDFNPSVTYSIPGQYEVVLMIQDTICNINDSIKTIIIVDQLNLSLQNDTILCIPTNLMLAPNITGSANTIIWSSNSNFSDTINSDYTIPNYQIFLDSNQQFFVKASNLACEVMDSIQVKIISSDVFLDNQVVVCNNDTVLVLVNNNSELDLNYLWSPQSMIYSVLNDSSVFVTSLTSNYLYVDISNTENNCSYKDSIFLQISPFSISLETSNDTILCASEEILLVANSNGTSTNFIWSNNANFSDTLNIFINNPNYLYSGDSTKTFYIKTFNQDCSLTDTVSVKIIASEVDLQNTNNICFDQLDTINVINTSGLNLTYTWYPDSLIRDQISETSIVADANQNSYIYIEVDSPSGCSYIDSTLIYVSNLTQNVIDAQSSDTIVLVGSEVTLNAVPQGNYNVIWTPNEGLQNNTSFQTTATINQTITYHVEITEGECRVKDSITIYCYYNECKPPQIFIPNAFSPNKKDKNEVLFVRGPNISEMLFRIYNRWGEMVFESTDPNIGWDGTFKGKAVDPDVFDYYLIVKCIGGKEDVIKGNVTVLK